MKTKRIQRKSFQQKRKKQGRLLLGIVYGSIFLFLGGMGWMFGNDLEKASIEYIQPVEKVTIQNRESEPSDTLPILKESMDTFINRFYTDYARGIKMGEEDFLDNYIVSANLQPIQEVYKQWYIDHKVVRDVNLRVEIEEMDTNQDGKTSIEVLEIVELTTEEYTGKEQVEKMYKVITGWGIEIIPHENSYKIERKDLKESIVSFQDEDKNWIAY